MLKRFENRTYYEMLGVSPDATPEELAKVYRDLSRIYHPDSKYYKDIANDPPTEVHAEIYKIITDAYAVLSDDQLRANYNDELKRNQSQQELDLKSAEFCLYHPKLNEIKAQGDLPPGERSQSQLLQISVKSTGGSPRSSQNRKKSRSVVRKENEWTQSIPTVSQIIERERSPVRSVMIVILGAVFGGVLGGTAYYFITHNF